MLEVTTPASDIGLLTLAELRAAASVSNASSDAALTALGDQVALVIARACNVAASGVTAPTLRLESLRETVRLTHAVESIVLSRRPVTSIVSVTLDGETLDPADYECAAGSGLLYRLDNDQRTWWGGSTKVVASYTAGYAVVPADIRMAATKLVTDLWSSRARDPNLKRVVVEGVSEREYWVPPTSDPLVSAEVMDILAPYRNAWVG